MERLFKLSIKAAVFAAGLILLPVLSSRLIIIYLPELDYDMLVKMSRLMFLIVYILLPLLFKIVFLKRLPKFLTFFGLYLGLVSLGILYGIAN